MATKKTTKKTTTKKEEPEVKVVEKVVTKVVEKGLDEDSKKDLLDLKTYVDQMYNLSENPRERQALQKWSRVISSVCSE